MPSLAPPAPTASPRPARPALAGAALALVLGTALPAASHALAGDAAPGLAVPVQNNAKPSPQGAPPQAVPPPAPAPRQAAPAPSSQGAPRIATRREDAANTPPLRPDQPLAVRLGRNQSAFFRIAPEAGNSYVVATRRLGRNTDTVMALLDANGQPIAEDDDGGDENLSSRIEVEPGQFPALLRVGTLGDGGAFEVVLTRVADPGPPNFATSAAEAANRPPLAVDQPVTLRLRAHQQAFFALPPDGDALVALTRNLRRNADTVLALVGEDGNVIVEDDDGGENLASRLALVEASGQRAVLRAGTLDNRGGEFELVLERDTSPPPTDIAADPAEAGRRPPLPIGEAVALRLRRGTQAVFALPPEAAGGLAVTFNLAGDTDTVLELLDADGRVLAENDDAESGLASRLELPAGSSPAFLRVHSLNDRISSFELAILRRPAR